MDVNPCLKHAPALACLMALALLSAACGRPAARPPAPDLIPGRTVQLVQQHAERGMDPVPAVLQAIRRATLSTRIPARVTHVYVAAGDAVQAGQVLVTLADDDVRAQVAGAQATFATAAAQERRLISLTEQGASPKSQLETAQAQRAQAEASLRAAEESLRYTQLRAPFDGRVQAKRANEGDFVMAGSPLLEVEGSELELVASLSAQEVAGLAHGQSVDFEVGPLRGHAVVTAVAPAADSLAHRVEVRARVVGAPPEFRGGLFARLLLPRAGAKGSEVWVPNTAVVQRGDLRGVFVAANGRAELRWVLAGDVVDGAVAIRAGLLPEESVIDRPGDLVDGQRIEVARAR